MIVWDMISYLWVFITTMIIALCGNKLFFKLWYLDRPWKDIIPSRSPVANYQGFFLLVAVRVAAIIWFPSILYNNQILWLFIGWTILGLFALINDVVDRYTDMKWIPALARLFIQLGLISLIVLQTKVYIWLTPFWIEINELVGFFLSVWRVLVFMNAINWFDFNGIAWWVSALWFMTIWLLITFVIIPFYNPIWESLFNLIQLNKTTLMLSCITIVFVIQELRPRWLLRDVWSNFLWFLLAYLALMWWAKVGLLVATLSLVICDAIWVVFRRIFVIKKSPLQGDYTHLHHRLQAIWRTRNEIRGFVRVRTIIMMILMLLQGNNSFNKLIIVLIFWGMFFWVHYYLYVIKKIPYEFKAK